MTLVLAHSSWTEERVNLLKRLWDEGLSASLIADELRGVSRCAVLGKAHRLGLSSRTTSCAASNRKRKPRSNGREEMRPPRVEYERDVAGEAIIPISQRRTLEQLTNKTCRWPVGDVGNPEFFFCGGPSDLLANLSYCSFHSRIAWARGKAA